MHPCPFCDDTFPSDFMFMKHIKLRHKTLIKSVCHCRHTGCARSFNNIYSFRRHYNSKHVVVSANVEPAKKETDVVDTSSCDDREDSNIHVNADVTDTETLRLIIEPCPSVSDFAAVVDEAVTSFTSKLYANSSLPRCFVQELIEDLKKMYSSTFIPVLRQKYNCSECKESPENFNLMFDIIQQAFDNFETEHQSLKRLEGMKYLIKPESVVVNAMLKSRAIAGERSVVVSNATIQVISIKSVLIQFLQLPNVFSSIISHYEYCKANKSIISAVQGTLWKEIEIRFNGKLVLPLTIYFDDFEINNPLGSHKNVHKLGAVYFSIACVPNEYCSMLENILLAQLHHTQDHKTIGNKKTFANLIEQIIDLEKNGLTVRVDGKENRVYFALLSIVGDNLGIHEICGYTTSFNSINWCRVCLAEKVVAQYQLEENTQILRTVENYSIDSANCSNGVNEECVFNEIPSYHVIENVCLDIMHDVFEGVCRYEMAKILKKYILEENFFSLEVLNSRIQHMDYGTSVGKNIPISISSSFLKTQSLILSASEMKFLVCNLGLIIGDLVPLDDRTWEIYLNLREIIDILLASSITIETTELLATLISEHHSLYLDLFSEALKPKHHLLLHYPRLMAKLGPLINFSCIRFEGKHNELKKNAKVVSSRRNPAYTIALKHQLTQAYRFISQEGFQNRLKSGPVLNEKLSSLVALHSLQNVVPLHIINDSICTSWVQVSGTFYRTGMAILTDSDNINYSFSKVKYIIIRGKHVVSFLHIRLRRLCLSRHIHALEVEETETWGFSNQKELCNHCPRNLHRMADGKMYVSLT